MSMLEWTRNIEQIVLSAINDTNRIVGIAAIASGAGTSLLCHSLAITTADGGLKTLRINFGLPASQSPDADSTAVGSEEAVWVPGRTKPKALIRSTPSGYDLLEVRTTKSTRPLFANMALMRHVLAEEFAEYSRVIVELPALTAHSLHAPNPVSLAGACNATLLLVVVGRDLRPDVQHAVTSLERAGVKIAAVVTTTFGQLSPGEEASRMVKSVRARVTKLVMGRRWVRRKSRTQPDEAVRRSA